MHSLGAPQDLGYTASEMQRHVAPIEDLGCLDRSLQNVDKMPRYILYDVNTLSEYS